MQVGTAAAIAIGASVATGAAIGSSAGLATSPQSVGGFTRQEGSAIAGWTVGGSLVGAGVGAICQDESLKPWSKTSMKQSAGIGAAMLGGALLAGTVAYAVAN